MVRFEWNSMKKDIESIFTTDELTNLSKDNNFQ